MAEERDVGGGAIPAPDALGFMAEFTQNAQIFNELLMPVLMGSAGLVLAHETTLSNLEAGLSKKIDPVKKYLGRLETLEESAEAVIRAAEAIKAQGTDNSEWQAPERLGNEDGPF